MSKPIRHTGSEPPVPPKKHPGKKARKNAPFLKILTRTGLVLLLLIPTYLAIISYLLVKNAPEETVETYYTSIDIQGPTGYQFSATPSGSGEVEKSEQTQLFDCFLLMLTDAVYTPGVPDTHTGQYTVTMHTNTGSENYIFHFAPTDGSGYYTNAEGVTYRTADNSADYFLNSPYAYELYPQSTPPILTTAATDKVIPTKLSWSYQTNSGTFADLTQLTTTPQILTYPIQDDIIKFEFSLIPTNCHLIILHNDTVLYEGESLDNISLNQITEVNLTEVDVLDFEIEATYAQDSRYNYHGQVTYQFRMRVVDPANFSLNRTASTLGGYFMLSCTNVRNAENLKISATPALESAPIVFKRNDIVYAAIPADTVGTRHLIVEYGTNKNEFYLTVNGNGTDTDPLAVPPNLNAMWQDALNGRLDALTALMGAESDTGFPVPGSFTFPDGSGTDRVLAFGDRVTVSSTEYTVPFELYETNGMVCALAAGKVVQTGTDELLGHYAIIDHGGGLYTWYCGLSSVEVSTGQPIAIGDTVGRAGQTGLRLADRNSVMILATWGKTAVSPQYLRENPPVIGS